MDDRIRKSEYILIRILNGKDFTSFSKTAAFSLLKNPRFVKGPWIDFLERKRSPLNFQRRVRETVISRSSE
ncbi:hypothetical protein DLM75_18540 [Leptospira stimsonii]|uniref:Uncharacterized protein n=1 Tax=Leptospira stimsonii TaxID=2202203 RepID=A0A396YZX5_9LEPT|nr:hypothetical protein DLM75_18540 [Leptospira stimsonii]